jgi:hypothetical protein
VLFVKIQNEQLIKENKMQSDQFGNNSMRCGSCQTTGSPQQLLQENYGYPILLFDSELVLQQ